MREPHFWRALPPRSRASAPVTRMLLTPFAAAYAWAGRKRLRDGTPVDPGVPVVCIGNLTLGGAGKTPVATEIRRRLVERGLRAATLSRGHGGSEEGPLRVDPERHNARQVGDEPLMLAGYGEAWISKDRAEGAETMSAEGVEVIVMDDGHQSPAVRKTLSLVVIDAAEPFGNGHIFPKGPLREPVAAGIERADGVVLMGEGLVPDAVTAAEKPVLRARLAPVGELPAGTYVAFAGIGRPERFFDAVRDTRGVELSEAVPYPDHHVFTASDLKFLNVLAQERGAKLVATEKDVVRLPPDMRARVVPARVTAKFEASPVLEEFISRLAAGGRRHVR